jgi:hypothetical protein
VHSRYSPKNASLGQAFPHYLIGNKSFYLRTLKTFEFIMMGQSKWFIAKQNKKKTLSFGMHAQLINMDCK